MKLSFIRCYLESAKSESEVKPKAAGLIGDFVLLRCV